MMQKTIVLGSDHRGLDLKNTLYTTLKTLGYNVLDYGPHSEVIKTDYADYAQKVSEHVLNAEDEVTIGILVCNSGIGISMAANRFPGIRAVLCYNAEHAELARKHNNANIIALGASKTDINEALNIVDTFLKTPFEGGRHVARIEKMDNFCSIKR